MTTITLGDEAKDMVTGFQGIAVARTEWLNGCVRISLQSNKLTKEGAPNDAHVFDEPQLVLVKAKKVVVKQEPTGGPAHPLRQHMSISMGTKTPASRSVMAKALRNPKIPRRA